MPDTEYSSEYKSCPSHCCIVHGCKYGHKECPVTTGKVVQQYTCEDCEWDGIDSVADIQKFLDGQIKVCPHCKHILEEE
jgi:hypothetical protein